MALPDRQFGLRVFCISLFGCGIAALFAFYATRHFLWRNNLSAALESERSLIVSLREDVAMARAELYAARDEIHHTRKEVARTQKLLRNAAPNIILPHMGVEDIRKSAFLIVEVDDWGTDKSGMGYSTITWVNSQGARVTYAFKVDEQNLDPVSRVLLKGGRLAVERQKKLSETQ